jgi:hypothetical protein
MKKVIIIAIVIIAVGLGVYFYFKKKTTTNTNINTSTVTVTAPAPSVILKTGGTATAGTNEYAIISHMNWLLVNSMSWALQVKAQYSFTTNNQALCFLAITEGKTGNKDVSLDYAGTSNIEVAAWIKKYVS